jgi:hypothetical protein
MVLGGVFFKNFTQNSTSFVFFGVFFAVFFRGQGLDLLPWARRACAESAGSLLSPVDELENHAQGLALQ